MLEYGETPEEKVKRLFGLTNEQYRKGGETESPAGGEDPQRAVNRMLGLPGADFARHAGSGAGPAAGMQGGGEDIQRAVNRQLGLSDADFAKYVGNDPGTREGMGLGMNHSGRMDHRFPPDRYAKAIA